MEVPIPDLQSACVEEIREIQRRERIPGVVKRFILLDADTFWEGGVCRDASSLRKTWIF